MQFEDKDHYLLVFLLPLAVLLYVLTPFVGAVRLLQAALSAIVALLFYFMLWVCWPDMFPLWSATMAILVLVIMLVMIGLVYVVAWAVAVVALALVAVPAIHHNAAWIAVLFGAPPWAGYLIMTAGVVLLVLLLWAASIFPIVRTLVKCAFSSFFLMAMLRTVHLEEPPDLERTGLACGGGSDDPAGRCPYVLDSLPFFALWVALVVVLLWVMRARRKARKQRARDADEIERQRRIDQYNHLVDRENPVLDQPRPPGGPFGYASLVHTATPPCRTI